MGVALTCCLRWFPLAQHRARGPGGAKALWPQDPGLGITPPTPRPPKLWGVIWPRNHLGTCRILSREPNGYGFMLLSFVTNGDTHCTLCTHHARPNASLQSSAIGFSWLAPALQRGWNGRGVKVCIGVFKYAFYLTEQRCQSSKCLHRQQHIASLGNSSVRLAVFLLGQSDLDIGTAFRMITVGPSAWGSAASKISVFVNAKADESLSASPAHLRWQTLIARWLRWMTSPFQ